MRPIDADKFEVISGYIPEGYDVDSYLAGNKEILEMIDNAPTIDVVSVGVLEQYKWERDVAIAQLEELGIGFGQVKPDIEVVRHGYWIEIEENETGHLLECSECKEWIFHNFNYISNYCSHCGAKMDLEEYENEGKD